MKKIFTFLFSLQLFLFQSSFIALADEVPDAPFEEAESLPEDSDTEVPELEPEDPEPIPESEPESESESESEIDSAIVINEVLADPSEKDSENEFIELYNMGSEPVDLLGWQLDDARSDGGLYTFDNESLNYVLEPDSYLVFFRPETKITLNNDTDSVSLFNAEGELMDFFEFDSQGSGRSWGRSPENYEEWLVFKTPTPGELNFIEPNKIPVAVIEIQKDTKHMKLNVTGESSYDPDGDKLTFLWELEEGVFDERENPLKYTYEQSGEKIVRLRVTDSYGDFSEAEITFEAKPKGSGGGPEDEIYPIYNLINEVMPSPEGKDDENEWVELYNPNPFGIDLSGWYIDDAEGKSRPYKIPDFTVIMPDSYLVFSEPDIGLSFKNSEDVVRVLDPNKNVNQEIKYSEAQENWTYARVSGDLYEWTPNFTPGDPNDFPPPPKPYQPGDVVFESVLPNPEGTDSGNEKIILSNKTFEPVSLAGWSILDASGSEKLLADLSIQPEDSLTLVGQDFKVSLNNSDESLTLFDATGNFIDEIKWKSSASGRWLFNPDALKNGMEAEVVRTIDGDTLVVSFDERRLTVRLIGVDTPETVHPFKPVEYFGKQASNFLSEKLGSQWVTLEFDENKIDKYGRVLAYVYLGDEMINRSIVAQGYGHAYTRFPFTHLEDFVLAESEAKESELGLWQNKKVGNLLLELLEEESEEELVLDEELLLLLEEEIVEEEVVLPEEAEAPVISGPDCSSEHLKIDSFLPAPKKGEATEYIKLINTGPVTICLYGWSLDDNLDVGSDPHVISGGAIAPGAIRTFRKQETKLSLNNSNDCVNLLDPWGMLVDQICYDKTHTNEVFSHTGGDWVPKPRSKKAKKKSSGLRHRFSRPLTSYQSDLPATVYSGLVAEVNDENQKLTLELNLNQKVTVSYANSPVDISLTRELIDFSKPVQISVYESGQFKSLLSIEPATADLRTVEPEEGGGRGTLLFLTILLLSPLVIYKVCPKILKK